MRHNAGHSSEYSLKVNVCQENPVLKTLFKCFALDIRLKRPEFSSELIFVYLSGFFALMLQSYDTG